MIQTPVGDYLAIKVPDRSRGYYFKKYSKFGYTNTIIFKSAYNFEKRIQTSLLGDWAVMAEIENGYIKTMNEALYDNRSRLGGFIDKKGVIKRVRKKFMIHAALNGIPLAFLNTSVTNEHEIITGKVLFIIRVA